MIIFLLFNILLFFVSFISFSSMIIRDIIYDREERKKEQAWLEKKEKCKKICCHNSFLKRSDFSMIEFYLNEYKSPSLVIYYIKRYINLFFDGAKYFNYTEKELYEVVEYINYKLEEYNYYLYLEIEKKYNEYWFFINKTSLDKHFFLC